VPEPGEDCVCHRPERNEGPSGPGAKLCAVTSSPVTPLTLALAAVAADGAGLHRVAFYLVLAAIPAAAGAALGAAADLVVGRPVLARTACTVAALVLLVMSSAVRANAAVGSALPPLALSALIGCLGAYALLGVVWLLWAPRPVPVRENSS